MRTIYIYFITLLISANVFAQNNSDLINIPFKLEPQTQDPAKLTNQTAFGFTIGVFGKVYIPINMTTDKVPTAAILLDIQTIGGSNRMYNLTLHMEGIDGKEYWVTHYVQMFGGKLKVSSKGYTPLSGNFSNSYIEINALPPTTIGGVLSYDGFTTYNNIWHNHSGGIARINYMYIKSITGITIVNSMNKLRIQNPRIAVPAEYAQIASRTTSNGKRGEYVSSGSGFFISSNGLIATNYHVIEDANGIDVLVKRNGSVKTYQAKVLVSDKVNDLSILKITDPTFTSMPALPYAVKTSIIDVGTSVFALGYPLSSVLGEEIKATDGIISSKTGYQGDVVTYQISAPIQPGNSGGPLFDKYGNIVGITNAGIPGAENVGYAIKTSYLRNLTDCAPTTIRLPSNNSISGLSLPEKIKRVSPYIVLIKTY